MGRSLRSCRVSVSLTAQEKKILERLADKSGLSLSRVVQEAVGDFIKVNTDRKIEVIKKRLERK